MGSQILDDKVLPEELILETFYFHKLAYESGSCEWQWRWHKLAYVCRRWRIIIFASQHRLDLRLLCTPKTSIKQKLDLWPPFPIIVRNDADTYHLFDGWNNIIAALQQRDRVCEIDLILHGPQSKKVSQIMQESFPLLDRLALQGWDSRSTVCPSTFLGGSALVFVFCTWMSFAIQH